MKKEIDYYARAKAKIEKGTGQRLTKRERKALDGKGYKGYYNTGRNRAERRREM